MRRDKCDVFKIPNRMVKTNQDVTGEQCVRNHDGVGALSDEDKKITWKNYHENLLNTEFAYDREKFVSGRCSQRHTSLNRQGHGQRVNQ